MPTLRFHSFEPEAFAGINSTIAKDLVICFNGPNKDARIVELSGDQGKRKTSLLQFIKVMCGGELPDNALNDEDDDMRGTQYFEMGDTQYKVRLTKKGFTVTATSPEGKDTKNSPKEHLRDKIGNIGLSPMLLKDKSGAKQIEWLREVCKLTSEQKTLEKRIQDGYQTAYDKRTDVNRDLARYKKELTDTGYYIWDDENKVLATTEALKEDTIVVEKNNYNDEEIAQKHKAASDKVRLYNNSVDFVAKSKESRILQAKKVDELKAQLAEAETLLSTTDAQITKGETWLSENKDPQKELDAALELMRNSGSITVKKVAIATAKHKLSEYVQIEQHKINLEAEIEEYKEQQKNFVVATTPEIEGLEIVVGNWHPEKEEGIYYFGKTPAQLSESESWQLFIELCRALDIKVAIVENISSLGSNAISVINEFAESGGYVFCSKMDRSQKELTISFHHKYPV